ncbi:MAG: hypothetical protein JJU36_11110 [Phycisphaeraceae bacterium]|nr:hypothetical protein [Phycisphaeraceae bacterium]
MPEATTSAPGLFVGFGFGPIQSALFALEAQRSDYFRRMVIAEVDSVLVEAVNRHAGTYWINIADTDGIEAVQLRGLELRNPGEANDREHLIEAIANADEAATALPSVRFFDRGGRACAASILAEGIQRRTRSSPLLIYAAENDNHAAELLTEKVAALLPRDRHDRFEVVNTVIGKMSGVITDAPTIERLGLKRAVPDLPRAVLVEAFNRILISQPRRAGVASRIPVFTAKPELLPFEEAKLFGHNAVHALLGYLGRDRGYVSMAEAGGDDSLRSLARRAFLEECGAGLIHRHGDHGDELFTPEGWRAYADDLLARMANPHLNDLVERVTRDPRRKLGYNDRLFGPMRLALEAGVMPRIMARGAAEAIVQLVGEAADHGDWPKDLPPESLITPRPEPAHINALLKWLWGGEEQPGLDMLVRLVADAMSQRAED